MANKSLFTIQYSHALDKFFLTEKENPESGIPFEIPIIDCENGTLIELGSMMVDKEKIDCSKPSQLSFSNPFNAPILTTGYGLLYNYAAAITEGFAPAGWRLPIYADISTLMWAVGNGATAGGALKCAGYDWWDSPNTGATDAHGFSAPGSGRRGVSSTPGLLKRSVDYWVKDIYGEGTTGTFSFDYNIAQFTMATLNANLGMSIRFVKEDSINPGFIYDFEGRKIPTVKIGNQVWTAINWKSKFLFDGTPIPFISNEEEWGVSGAMECCNPDCDESLI